MFLFCVLNAYNIYIKKKYCLADLTYNTTTIYNHNRSCKVYVNKTHENACEVYSLLYHSAAIQEVFTLLILAWKRTVYFEEGIFNAERANSMIGQIIQTRPRHLLLATITKEEVDWEANIFVFRTGHQRTFVRYGKQIYLLTNISKVFYRTTDDYIRHYWSHIPWLKISFLKPIE